MSDPIERQDAIDAVQKYKCEHGYDYADCACDIEKDLKALPSAQPETDGFCTDCKEYDQERHFCPRFDRVIKTTIDEMKTEQRWIPCSERLPERNGRYLVTRGLNACGSLWNRTYIANYSDLMGLKKEKIWWDGNVGKSDFAKLDDVIAWMPLPSPYQAERREE